MRWFAGTCWLVATSAFGIQSRTEPDPVPSTALGSIRVEPPPSRDPADTDRQHWSIPDERAAIACALSWLGIAESDTQEVCVQLIVAQDDSTPHLGGSIDGRKLWRVTLTGAKFFVTIKSKLGMPAELAPWRTVDVFLSPVGGMLMKAVSRWPVDKPGIAPEPGRTSATQQLLDGGRECWSSFVDSPPPTTLAEALCELDRQGWKPTQAAQLVAHCVMWTVMDRQPSKPVWSIHLRGIEPFDANGPGVPIEARNHLRHLLDAKTGEWFRATTAPQPTEPMPMPVPKEAPLSPKEDITK